MGFYNLTENKWIIWNDYESIVDCRTFDVNDTGRISESKFRQILATKQVPKEDVDGILEGEIVAHMKYQKIIAHMK